MVHHSGLRKMTAADTGAVYAIEQVVSLAPWSEKLFSDCIEVGYECWVLLEDKIIIGFGILSYAANEAHILNLAIEPSKQHQGHGQKVLQHLLEMAKIHGSEEIFLEVRESNSVAQELYKKFNFVEIGIRKGYYESVNGAEREDALTFALPLW
jgi:ribosomal-protein-alanine N-acetyltransferase